MTLLRSALAASNIMISRSYEFMHMCVLARQVARNLVSFKSAS
jgi:hypothetical protein